MATMPKLQVNTTPFPEKLTFGDLLIVPQYSDITSKSEEITLTHTVGNTVMNIPIISAAMDTVTESDMMLFMREAGGLGIHHRYLNDHINDLIELSKLGPIAVSPSMNAGFFMDLAQFAEDNDFVPIVKIDVAHGDTQYVHDFCVFLKQFKFIVWSGNIATVAAADVYSNLLDPETDSLVINIGNGSVCTTRIMGGIGYPSAMAIYEIHQAYPEFSIISDGGIGSPADAVKALALGADALIIGRLLAGTDQSPSEYFIDNDWLAWKKYAGMAAPETLRRAGKTVREEGISGKVPYIGDAGNVINRLTEGIKTGMGYVGARTIKELQEKAQFVRITEAGRYEGQARI